MKKTLVVCLLFLVFASGCTDQAVNTTSLNFEKQGDNYKLLPDENTISYNKLIDDLNSLNIDLNRDTEVAVITTSTANILNALNMNIVGVTNSSDLDDDLKSKIEEGKVQDLGSPLDPNLEELIKLDPDVVFVGSNMPHKDNYDNIDNLVVLPQDYYYDIFYTTSALIGEFNLGNESQKVFDELVEEDQKAKSLAKDKEILGTTIALKYAYGNVIIASDDTYVGSLLTELHIDNMYGDLKDVDLPMSQEQLLLDNPDNIIIYGKGDDMQDTLNELKKNPKLENLKAYQNSNIYVLQSTSLSVDIDSPKTLLKLSEDMYGK